MEPKMEAIEAKRSYRKRKQQPSNPLTGIFTRGKSRKFLHHCNRSGKLRPDPVRKTRQFSPPDFPLLNPKVALIQSSNDDEASHVLIKDLRARRVFSEPLVVNEGQGNGSEDGSGKNINPNLDPKLIVKSDEFGGFVENPNFLVSQKCDSEVGCNDEGLNDGNPNLSGKCDSGVDFQNGRNPNLSGKCDSGVDFQDPSSNDGNPNLLEKCDLGVDFQDLGLNGGNPNLLEKCDSGVDFKDLGLNGGNSSSMMESIGISGAENDQEKVDAEKEENFDVGLVCNGSVKDDMSPNLSDRDLNGRKCENSEGLAEENVQTTPPDAVISVSQTEDCNAVVKGNAASSSPQNRVGPRKDVFVEGKKTNPILRKTSVMKPCSRPKVFKALNSFSYRRLLPYLMDLAKDTSSPLKLDASPKPENGVTVKSLASASRDSLSISHKLDEKQVIIEPVYGVQEVSTGTNPKEEKELSLDSKVAKDTSSPLKLDACPESENDDTVKCLTSASRDRLHISHKAEEKQVITEPVCGVQEVSSGTNPQEERELSLEPNLAKNTSSPLKLDACSKSENGDTVKSLVSASRDSLSDSHKSDEKQVITELVYGVQEATAGTNPKEEKELSLNPDSSTHHASTQTLINQSHDSGQSYLLSHENHNVTHLSNESLKGGALHDEHISSDNLEKLADASPVNESHVATLPDIHKESPEASGKDAAVEAPCHLSLYAAGECRTSQVEFKTKESSISVFHSSSKVEGFVSSSGPIVSLAKGILQKNPRGCRGICNCLNCASFRLNAEKAFEFSKNQLLDSEELVQDLVKEIANLRCLLEKSADGAKSLATIPVNQVQEACSRASNVEAIARNRLSQMKEDLYVHCRTKPLQRPRVNFSADVKEEVMGDLSKQIDRKPMSRTRTRRVRR